MKTIITKFDLVCDVTDDVSAIMNFDKSYEFIFY